MRARLKFLARLMLQLPALRRIRRNHGLEHATVHLLTRAQHSAQALGHSQEHGFLLYTDAPPQAVENAAYRALERLRAGEHGLAIHPGCGTSRLTSGLLVSLVAAIALGGSTRREALRRLSWLPGVMMLTLLLAEPAGLLLQKHFTTEGDPGDLEILEIRHRRARMPLALRPATRYFVHTRST